MKKVLAYILAAMLVVLALPITVFGVEYNLGDVNNDGKISAVDAREALRIAVGFNACEKDSAEYIAADVDFDGTVRAADARLILRAGAGLEELKEKEEATATDGEATATDGEATATDGEATATDGEATATDGEATATDGEATATDGEATATDGEEEVVLHAPEIVCEYTVSGSELTLTLYLKDGVGTKAYDYNIEYDTTALKPLKFRTNKTFDVTDNTNLLNNISDGVLKCAGYFKEELYSAEYYAEVGETVDSDYYYLTEVVFTILDENVLNTKITLDVYNDTEYTIGNSSTYKCALSEDAEFAAGDVDKDGKITAADARLALRASVGLESYAEGSSEFKACDVDNDGKVTAADARLILRASVGLETLK